MKPRKQISQPKSDKVHLTFCDVAACFSEEEWKLLHHWQKELYKNVMKEIHQAMISLGPQIAAAVFSLRPNENDDLCFMDLQGYEIKGTIYPSSKDTLSDPDALFMGSQYANDVPDTGSNIFNSNIIMVEEAEPAEGLTDLDEAGREAEDTTSASLGYVGVVHTVSSDIKREAELHSIESQNSDGSEGLANTTMTRCLCRLFSVTGPEETISLSSVGINEDGETYAINNHDDQRKRRFYSPTGNGRMKRKKNLGSYLICKNKSSLQKSMATNSKTSVPQNLQERDNSGSDIWSGSDPYLTKVENVQWQGTCSEVRDSISVTTAVNVQISEEYKKCEQAVNGDNIFPDETNATQSFGPYICTESNQPYQKKSHVVNSQQHKVNGRYKCIECGKNFSAKSKLTKHEMIHTGERPYGCTICGKSFNQKGVLHRHQKVHTGERPYQCKVCGKNFTLKHNLLAHHIIHTGDRPYQCNICVKSFNRKDHLLQHQRIHAKEQHFERLFFKDV